MCYLNPSNITDWYVIHLDVYSKNSMAHYCFANHMLVTCGVIFCRSQKICVHLLVCTHLKYYYCTLWYMAIIIMMMKIKIPLVSDMKNYCVWSHCTWSKRETFTCIYFLLPDIKLVCLGPLTNVALALHLDSDFGKKVSCYVMGGNYGGKVTHQNAHQNSELFSHLF